MHQAYRLSTLQTLIVSCPVSRLFETEDFILFEGSRMLVLPRAPTQAL